MKIQKISELKEGDVIRHVSDSMMGNGTALRVVSTDGETATAIRVVTVSNPSEWELVVRVENRWV
jgi:hypothetical protein